MRVPSKNSSVKNEPHLCLCPEKQNGLHYSCGTASEIKSPQKHKNDPQSDVGKRTTAIQTFKRALEGKRRAKQLTPLAAAFVAFVVNEGEVVFR